MFHSELNNFVVKFHQLWKAGYNAHLNVDSHAGYAWCGLRVDLGAAPAAPRHQQQVRPGPRRHAPSYRRRLETRAAARAATAEDAEEATKDATETAEAAEDAAAAARVTEAVIAVGTGVAATARKIAEKAEAAKKSAEEAEVTEVSNEVIEPTFEFSAPIAEEANSDKMKETPAEEVRVMENGNFTRSEERISVSAFLESGVIETFPSSIMKVPPGFPAPEWFCDQLGTRHHHGNVKFMMTSELQTMLGHHASHVITHYQFVKRLWAYMSNLPLNKDEFVTSVRCAPIFGSGVRRCSDIKKCLGDHVCFKSSRVGVFSGQRFE